MLFPKVKQPRKKSVLAAEALVKVIRDRFRVGDKLPAERELAAAMDISRSTLREAVAALQLTGVIEVRHSLGNFVSALPEPSSLRGDLEDIFSGENDPLGMVEARLAFEPGVARMAAQRMDASGREALCAALRRLIACAGTADRAVWAGADERFHLAVAEATGNAIVTRVLRPLLAVLGSPLWGAMRTETDREKVRRIRIREHLAVFNAVYEKKPDQAARMMLVHLEQSGKRFLAQSDS